MLDLKRIYDNLFGRSFKASVLTSLLWLNGLVTLPSLLLFFLVESMFKQIVFATIFVGTIAFTMIKYHYFSRTNPRMLQSEKYQIETHKLEIVAQKGGSVEFAPVDISLSDYERQLPPGDEQPYGRGGSNE